MDVSKLCSPDLEDIITGLDGSATFNSARKSSEHWKGIYFGKAVIMRRYRLS